MRLGLFHASLPQPGRKPGGVEVFVHRLGQELSQAGHEVTMLSYTDPPADSFYRHRPLSPRRFADAQLARLTAVPVLLNWADTSGLDLLHLHGDDWFYVRRRTATMRTFHGYAPYEARYGTRPRLRARQMVTWPLEALASRLATVSYAGTQGSPPAALPGGRRAALRALGCPSRRPRARARCHPCCSWAPGKGESGGRCSRRRSSGTCYRRASAFCLPSSYEGFGIPYLEAMGAGTPVVATPNPGSRMIIGDGGSGVLAADHELGPSLVRVLGEPELRAGLIEAGRKRAADFAWNKVVEAHEDAYRELLARPG